MSRDACCHAGVVKVLSTADNPAQPDLKKHILPIKASVLHARRQPMKQIKQVPGLARPSRGAVGGSQKPTVRDRIPG